VGDLLTSDDRQETADRLDHLQAHRSRLVIEYVEGLNGRIALEHHGLR